MDIQALFEQCSVPEIQAKLEETRQNIEKEREELRIMVRQDRKRRLYDIGARVKLLMDMPETLWLRVERRETLTAALLHLLAQYIFTGLQVERLHGAEGQRVMKQFPVVVRQWTAIQRFRATILSSCHAAVRDATLQQLEVGRWTGGVGRGRTAVRDATLQQLEVGRWTGGVGRGRTAVRDATLQQLEVGRWTGGVGRGRTAVRDATLQQLEVGRWTGGVGRGRTAVRDATLQQLEVGRWTDGVGRGRTAVRDATLQQLEQLEVGRWTGGVGRGRTAVRDATLQQLEVGRWTGGVGRGRTAVRDATLQQLEVGRWTGGVGRGRTAVRDATLQQLEVGRWTGGVGRGRTAVRDATLQQLEVGRWTGGVGRGRTAVRDATLQQLELVGSCLVAAALLEGSSARAACSHLLRERREAVLAAVRADSAEDSVQRQVARAARLLLHTLQLVMALFVGHNPLNDCPEGQFVTRLRDVIANQKPFELVDDRGSVAMRHLSADIKGYRPSVAAAESSLPADQVQTMVSEWLQQLAEQLRPRVAQLLEGVPSVKGLASVRDGVYSVLSEDPHRQHWGDICRTLTGAELSIWELFPREAILVRAEQHIKAGLSSAFSAVTESLAQTVKAGDRLKSAVDIVDYRWSDVNEAPSVSGWMNYRHRNQQSLPGLVLRARGHCGPVQELCAALDSRLDALLTDVRHYTERPESARPAPGEAAAPSAAPPPFDPWRDSGRLAETLREQTRAQLDGLLTELERLAESPEQQSAAVLLARVPRGVTDLCPHLPLCLDATARGKQPSGAGRALWEELAQQLLRVRPALMRRWCEARAAQLDQELSDALKTATDAQLSDFALWAAVTITEEADSGEQVESCSVRRLVDVYWRHLAASDVTPPSQHHALQALVDVHFLKTLASARDQELTKKIGSTCEAIEEHIDPFDLNVCWPHAVKYLRQYTQQSQSVLGALSVDRGPARPAGPAPAASGQPEPHSLLALADRPVRFSLLAVPDSAPLERPPRPLPSCPARLDKMASQQSPKKADAIKPSPSFLANFSGSWF
ncbi:Conserved oligomeric Golgi complex subunit 1 [Amphibalanus amphitrite]|nr:Conserved oligomeric Golgi complex subunit 1 [Amphibalanus amphitrite]KAF0305710.1 Conserved oligomeric Golgi complex subunit 1 [Amphibalanus amphitrite]